METRNEVTGGVRIEVEGKVNGKRKTKSHTNTEKVGFVFVCFVGEWTKLEYV